MTLPRIATVTLGLAALPVSCIAAVPPAQKVQPAKPATPVVAKPAAPASIGKFKLNRTPQQGTMALGWAPAGTVRVVADGQDAQVAPDGRFVIAFGRDYATSALVTAFLRDGSTITDRIPVARRAWKIDHLKNLPHHSQPDAEFQARRPGELAQINAARRIKAMSDGWRQQFIWPAKGRISGVFGSQRVYAGQPGAPHSGVDVAGATGTPVVSPADGVVILAASSPFTLEGNLLMIDHGFGVNSSFLHLSKIEVKKGDIVRQGQRVGAIGMTGRATGPHLHWSMKWQDERIDPATIVGKMWP